MQKKFLMPALLAATLLAACGPKDNSADSGAQTQMTPDMQALAAGSKFLDDNSKKPGVKTTASGLQYMVLREGTGSHPTATDNVTVNYRGTLIDGTEFDNSKKYPDRSNVYPMGGVIRGWAEALERMNPGAKWRLFVPSDLAYGSDGGPNIGPNATLIYDLELVSISRERPKPTAEELKYDRDHIDED